MVTLYQHTGVSHMPSTETDLLEKGLLGVPEAAEFLGLSRSDLYARMEHGELAYCKIGRRRLIRR